MRTSETVAKLAAALVKVQAEITDPVMTGEGQVGGKKTAARKYPYALLTDVLAVARKALAANEIVFTQTLDLDRSAMITRLMHSSGEWMEGDYPVARSADPQSQGSANTYARRYALMSILGIAGETDDDGEGAKERPRNEVDAAEERSKGAAGARTWMAKQLLLPAADGYSGAGFHNALKKAGITYSLEHIKLWCLWLGRDKPSRMKPAARDTLVRFLASEKGEESWQKFAKECGPLPVPRKKAAKKWTGEQQKAFSADVEKLQWTVKEIGQWCEAHNRPHPAEMTEKQRQKLLVWLETDGEDGKSGSDVIHAWLEEQQ